MTTASPTPLGVSTFGNGRPSRPRPPIRTTSARPQLRRNSPLSALSHGDGFQADAPMLQRISIGDSSDEDVPKPMNFSALTKALLEDKSNARPKSPPPQPNRSEIYRPYHVHSKQNSEVSQSRAATPPRGTLRITRKTPPQDVNRENEMHRVVHLSGSRRSGELRRTKSSLEGSSRSGEGTPQELVTPAPQPRIKASESQGANTRNSAEQMNGRSGSVGHLSSSSGAPQAHASSSSYTSSYENDADGDNEAMAQSRSRSGAESLHGSMRVRRPPIGTGTLLRGAPMRRGIRRQPGEDGNSPPYDEPKRVDSDYVGSQDQRDDMMRNADLPTDNRQYASENGKATEPIMKASESRKNEACLASSNGADQPSSNEKALYPSSNQDRRSESRTSNAHPAQPIYRVPDLPPKANLFDQENEPPPTFKRNKGQVQGVLGNREKPEKPAVRDGEPNIKPEKDERDAQAPSIRSALQPLSQNTPLRPAPPPPKMSVTDAAIVAAGASTIKSKKKRSHVIVNGKLFEIRGRIGRGGSSNVYRVMAENDKMFALKRVNLEDCNEDTVRGYKGEIELLKTLENEERVVRLFDYEVNEQKQSLSVLMEMGESDLNKVLATRLQPEDATLDLSFTRHYWKEMLNCVAAVHSHDIVHSDLKPANFLLVGGRLKLIDFGIANAIDTENTINVHRETNVGTPNYMSPESLQDTNAGTDSRQPGGGHAGRGATKLMKLGKPSDIWSLGCILYQMTYGKPPFAHIANTWNRVCAIINPSVHISFPTTGIGGTYVPGSLRRLLQRCLDRDQKKRPTLRQLLDARESFLNPDAESEDAVPMTEALLGQILMKVVQRCKDEKRGFPTEGELMKTYPRGYMENIRASLERG